MSRLENMLNSFLAYKWPQKIGNFKIQRNMYQDNILMCLHANFHKKMINFERVIANLLESVPPCAPCVI